MTQAPEKLPITVAIPIRNEERNLEQCLERLSRFADVVIIDSQSTDNSVAIAQKHGARVIQFEWNGQYPKKRNWFLQTHTPEQPWVLFLDADEFIDDGFCDELARAITNAGIDGYWLNYTNYFLGSRLNHGIRQRKLALFRVGKGQYERIDEERWSGLDMEIHEHPIIDGPTGEILAPIDHRDYKGLENFISKHREYALWEAQRYLRLHSTSDAQDSFTDRQKFKYAHLAKWWYPGFYFLAAYIARLGFLDGVAGFHYAFYKMWYFKTIRLLIKESDSVS